MNDWIHFRQNFKKVFLNNDDKWKAKLTDKDKEHGRKVLASLQEPQADIISQLERQLAEANLDPITHAELQEEINTLKRQMEFAEECIR